MFLSPLDDPSRPYGAMASAIRVRHAVFFSFLETFYPRSHCRSVSVGNGPVGALNPS
nr:MAG TPA: hypothetical protein [Caudoviricetes sp.]